MKTTTTKSKKQIKRRMGWLQIVTSFQINQMKVSIFAVCAYSSFHLKTTLGGLHILTTSSVTLLCVWIRNNISPDSGCLSKLLIPRNFLSMTWHFHEYYDEDKQNHINHTVLYFRNIIRRKSTMDNYLSNVEKSIRYIYRTWRVTHILHYNLFQLSCIEYSQTDHIYIEYETFVNYS
jgi:hypothetical protein